MDYTRKFVNWDVPKLEALKDCKAYQLRQRLNDGGKLNRGEKNWLTQAIHSNSYGRRCVCVMGGCLTSQILCICIGCVRQDRFQSIMQWTRLH